MSEELYKAVVYLDLARFSQISRKLHGSMGFRSEGIELLEKQIKSFVKNAVAETKEDLEACYVKSTGDGAVLCFDSPDDAHGFAEALLNASERHNRNAEDDMSRRHFRVGIVDGLMLRRKDNVPGLAIIDASRLESAAKCGEIVMAESAWQRLSTDCQELYWDLEMVLGKDHDPPIPARRCQIGEPAPWEREAEGTGIDPDYFDVFESLRERRVGTVAEPPSNLKAAFETGVEEVERFFYVVDKNNRSLTLDDVSKIIGKAIGYGAGIYNYRYSTQGRVLCGQLYHQAATGIVKRTEAPKNGSVEGVGLIRSWLAKVCDAHPKLADEDADDVAWELRFIFDAQHHCKLFDDVSRAIEVAAESAAQLQEFIMHMLVLSRQLEPQLHVGLFLLRHLADRLLALSESAGQEFFPALETEFLRRTRKKYPRVTQDDLKPQLRATANDLLRLAKAMRSNGWSWREKFGRG